MKLSITTLLIINGLFAGCSFTAKNSEPTIGSAEMKADGTIILQLRAESADGGVGEGYFVYPKNHPEYQNILDHVGPLNPGQNVFVKPWPEKKKTEPNQSLVPTTTAVTSPAAQESRQPRSRHT